MAYNNYFPQNQYQQQYYPQYQQMPMQQGNQPMQQAPVSIPSSPQDNNGIIWVQGESAARSYMVGAGRSVLLMDSDSSTFYLKSTDMSGMPQPLRIFDYTERTTQPQTNQIVDAPAREIDTSMFVTREELEERLAKITMPTATKTTVKTTATKG